MAVASSHVVVASVVAVGLLVLVTFVLCGGSPQRARQLVVGTDKRASTSKFGAASWTYAICFALLTLFVGQVLFGDFDAGWATFLRSGLNTDYLWLLGIPGAGMVGAMAVTQAKVAANPAAKPVKQSADNSLLTRARELGSDDAPDPQPVLADIQYLIFNGIAVLYFLGAFLHHVEDGLPTLPESLIGLTGASAAAYLATKAATRVGVPTIKSVRPSTIKLGAAEIPLVVSGSGFIPLGAGLPAAMLDGVSLTTANATPTGLTAYVPTIARAGELGLMPGRLELVVLSPQGIPSAAMEVVVTP